jgi:hypothetical protein
MIRSRFLSLALAALVVSATAACDVQVGDGDFSLDLASGRSQDTWARSYTLQPGSRFELINVNGRIQAEPSTGATVEVSSQRIAKASSDDAARDLLSKVEMREETGSERVRVEVRAPRTFGISSVEVQWTVKVPKGVVVDLRTVNGKVTLTGLDGEVRAETVNGGVEATGLLAHTVHATTVNGGVRVGFGRPLDGEGQVSIESVNGGVEVTLMPESKASVVARVTNGGIRHDSLPFAQTGEQSRRRFEGTLNGGGTRVSIETTNGGVRLSNSTS